ncbi:interferon epsilon [Nannospalax galili]|uniref:interferon epsilon n=1 Tax=Nannospalax galili TaxID=1026970 RepID=UPI0004ED0672|nr:interferon epsilon [Nannospalax galili]
MICKPLLEIVLVLLASSTVFSLEAKLILFQSRMNTRSLQLLNNLQISSIQQCLPHRKNFLLPQKSVAPYQYQKGHVLAVIQEILQQIFSLFQANVSLVSWEENYIEKFLTVLHQQLEYTESLLELEAEERTGALSVRNLRLKIKAYFRRIHDYLENHGYSSCAWIIVQVEINRCLLFVFRLTGWLSKQETDP